MHPRHRVFVVLALSWGLGMPACGPYLPPTTIPAVEAPVLESFRAALKVYVDQTQRFRRAAADAAEAVPNQTVPAGSDAAVRLRQQVLADAIRTQVRTAAQHGDLFSPAVGDEIRRELAVAFGGPKTAIIHDELENQNEGLSPAPVAVAINQAISAPRLPPVLLEVLPQLPPQVEFAFSGRTLILRDVDADVVVDYLLLAFPETPPTSPEPPGPAPKAGARETPFFALPGLPGATRFALIGDSGSGDAAQRSVADGMLRYFLTARRFTHVLMLGDNLYHDDYEREFATPYRGLLERGVLFYAALGNHDRELEQHYKPFHMTDRLYYAFTFGNARVVVLNTNRPGDAAQLAWLDGAFGNTGDKWRIGMFHHPLYSSGGHARQASEVIRPALEPALVRNRVDVVFSGHEHVYERIAPQRGIRYFVSGGAGRDLVRFRPSAFDEAGVSAHHFMVVEIAGDRLFFTALAPLGGTLDCGVIWRTPEAASAVADEVTRSWQAGCRAATAPAAVPK